MKRTPVPLENLPPSRDLEFATEVVDRLRAAGFVALWAGGCVRDLVMGNPPEDYDVATSARPEQVRQLFGFRHTLAIGASFGVIVVLSPERTAQQVEVATFRADAAYSDGRRPDSITFSNPEQDAQRRDFTINGMFFDPLAQEVIDFVGGRDDVERRVIRAIGLADERIKEDKLRMLRAIRFAARFDFELEPLTLQAVSRHAASIAVVSGERIAVEVQKTLQTERAAWAVDLWASTGLMHAILPELDWPAGREPTMQLLDQFRSKPTGTADPPCCDWRPRLAALLWSASDAVGRRRRIDVLRERLKWSNDDCRAIEFSLHMQDELPQAKQLPWSRVQPWILHPDFEVALELLAARSGLEPELRLVVEWLQQRAAWPEERLDPAPLLDGADLIRMGYRPSPLFGELLDQVRALQLDGLLSDRAAAVEWVQQHSSPG